jgi:S1-C subfamily serine protease
LKRFVPFVLGVAAAFIAIVLYSAFKSGPEQLTVSEMEDTVAQILASVTPPPSFSAQTYQIILPSLVIIQTERTGNDGEDQYGVGAGVIINRGADILTALHVVNDAAEIRLTFVDGTESNAIVASQNPESDIAVLTPAIPPFEFLPATIGSPAAMRVGDEAFAVGNPLGLVASMSAGVVSGFDRTFKPTNGHQALEGLIQFDAAVNPGNSGGPLLDRYGHVVGIVVGLVNPGDESAFAGIGFAVPINVAARGAGGPPQ